MTTRALVASVVGSLALLGAAAGFVAVQSRRLFEPEVRIQNEDYAETRRHFRTRLLRGSFNGWDSQHVLCGKENGRWVCRVDLPAGKYLYQFVVETNGLPIPTTRSSKTAATGAWLR